MKNGISSDIDLSEGKQEYLESFGLYIRALRKSSNIKAVQLASWLDTTKSSISRLESGGINPTLHNLKRLSEAMEMTLTELIDGFEKFQKGEI